MRFLFKYSDNMTPLALFVLRVGIGLTFMKYGYGKLMAGESNWIFLGSQMKHLGINFYPVVFGFIAALTEFVGGLFLVLGLFTRAASLALAFTMFVALKFHIADGSSYMHALQLLVVFVSLALSGPGKHSLDKKIF